jgi:hypothetical protein
MTIKTRRKYGLEVTIESDNAKITEDVSVPVYDQGQRTSTERVDESFKIDVKNLLEDIYEVERVPLSELLEEWYDQMNKGDQEDFLERIGAQRKD